ncbi:putative inorganic carbon transporter subunit DabA [Idiomarina tyrosinivorans]|nr:putative inorganic carbon transporter subunit DabA [Idiomarina tyrosinivorans]
MKQFIEQAKSVANSIAPMWPLDESIAINPCWEFTDQPIEQVAALWQFCGDIKLLMPLSFYRQQLGENDPEFVKQQFKLRGTENRDLPRWRNVAELLDQVQKRKQAIPWRDEVVANISQACGLYAQYPDRFAEKDSLYHHWLVLGRKDQGIESVMVEPELHERFHGLPDTADELFAACFDSMLKDVPEQARYCYLLALQMDVLGWASSFALQRWRHNDGRLVAELLAIRMAWDLILWLHCENRHPKRFVELRELFQQQIQAAPAAIETIKQQQQPLWQLQHRYESLQLDQFNWQPPSTSDTVAPAFQAVFCIDTRSERLRKGLEQQSDFQTFGFAGFFGLPINYQSPADGRVRAQAPGLLNPASMVTPATVSKKAGKLDIKALFKQPLASLTAVETLGFSRLPQLIGQGKNPRYDDLTALQALRVDAAETDVLNWLEGLLGGLGIEQWADDFVFVGHSSHHRNNAQQAAMKCGACGGQSGGVNAQLAAELLNQQPVREGLAERGWNIPTTTTFHAALHETVTDQLHMLTPNAPEALLKRFSDAADFARQHRYDSNESDNGGLLAWFQRKAKNWSEVRPEWGLADNCLLLFADRKRSRELSFNGRAFLHEYNASNDNNGELLAQLLQAPGIVAHWINSQYYTSVTDPDRLGSGNKLLHNRVANNVGVFEGNGGDLRIGLARQSVHDGNQWRHRPVRLRVVVDAEEQVIVRALEQAPPFRNLVDNGWLFIQRLSPAGELCPVSINAA